MTTSAGLWRLFQSHIDELQKRAERLLERENLELLAIHSGQQKRWFLDDMNYPFRANLTSKHGVQKRNYRTPGLSFN